MSPQTLPPEPAAATRTSAPPARETRSGALVEWLAKLGPLVGLVVVFGLFSYLVGKNFYGVPNGKLLLINTVVVAITALGMTMVIVSGGIDLSVGSTMAAVTVVIAQMLNRGYSGPTAVLAGIAVGGLAGFLIGLLITVLRLAPFIITLGAWGAYRGVARKLAEDQAVNVLDTPQWILNLLRQPDDHYAWNPFPTGVYVTLLLAVAVALTLRYTRFGRHVFAIGSNENTARLCGVHVGRTKVLIYTLSGLLTGIAGVMLFAYVGQGDPTAASGRELDVIAAVVIGGASLSGGQGTILGTLVGALFLTTIDNGCTKMGWSNYVQLIATGGIIVAAAAIDRLRHRRA